MQFLASQPTQTERNGIIHTFKKHKVEGYALSWSKLIGGKLLAGDCSGKINLYDVHSLVDDSQSFAGHANTSVEDLQWSPSEANVFASCATDGTVKIFDTRSKNPMLSEEAHKQDVNVIAWNSLVSYLLASGSDDCSFKVWDLRAGFGTKKSDPVGTLLEAKQAVL